MMHSKCKFPVKRCVDEPESTCLYYNSGELSTAMSATIIPICFIALISLLFALTSAKEGSTKKSKFTSVSTGTVSPAIQPRAKSIKDQKAAYLEIGKKD